MIAALLADLWPYLITALAALAGGVGIYIKGGSNAKAKAKTRDLREHIETRERMDNADIVGDDPSAAARWLQSRDPDQR